MANGEVVIAVVRTGLNTGVGYQDVTTADLGGLTPVAAWLVVTRAAADGVPTTGLCFSVGAATATGAQWTVGVTSEDNQATTDTDRRAMTDKCIMLLGQGVSSPDCEAEFVSFIANGVRLNVTDAPAAAYLLTVVLFAGDSVAARAGTFTVGNQDVAVDVADVGFTPEVLLLATHGAAFNDTGYTYNNVSLGAAVNDGSATQRCWAFYSTNGAGATLDAARLSDVYGVGSYAGGWYGQVSDFDGAGFSCTPRLAAGGGNGVGYLALRFDGVVGFWLGTVATPTATGAQAVTAPGFRPQCVLAGLTQLAGVDVEVTTGDAGSWGLSAFTAGAAFCASAQDEDAADPTDTQCLSDDQAVNLPAHDGSSGHAAAFVSMDSAGWTLDFSATLGAARYWWALAIEVAGEEEPPEPPPPVTTPASRPQARVLIADRTGRILAEVEPQVGPVSWRLNDVGRATLTFAKTDPKAIEDYLRFGNRLLIQLANGLPGWGGVIDPPRKWDQKSIQVTAYSAEYLLGMRQTGRGRCFDGATVGAIFRQLVQEANAVAPTGVALGGVWGGGQTHSPAYHFDELLKIIREGLTERLSTADFVVLAAEVSGYVTFTAHLYERRGMDKPGVALLEDHNLAGIDFNEQGPIVNCWDVVGQGTTWGDERPVAYAEDAASIAAYGRRQGSRLQADTASLATLREAAQNALVETAWPRNVLTLEAADLAPARFADYDVGDGVRVMLHAYGFGGYDGLVRILTREYDPAKGTCALVVQEAG